MSIRVMDKNFFLGGIGGSLTVKRYVERIGRKMTCRRFF